jgi:kumamolisin
VGIVIAPRRGIASAPVRLAIVGVAALLLATYLVDQRPAATVAGPGSGDVDPNVMEVAGLDERLDVEIGETDPDTVLDFSVVLRQPQPELLQRFLAGLHDPSSPDYRQYLTPAEFGRRFGPSDEEVEKVTAWLVSRGFDVAAPPPQRTSLAVRGTVRAVNDAFGLSMRDRIDDLGRPYHAPDREPQVPEPMREVVNVVASLNNRGQEPASVPALQAVPGGFLRPADVARAYEFEELHAQGLHGEGQAVGIVSFDTYHDSDIVAFDRAMRTAERAGAEPPAVRRVRLPGALTEPGDGSGEVNLDIDVIRTIAPAAEIINYEGPNGPFGPIIREIVSRQEVDIVSISWGICERKMDPNERVADDAEFAAAAAIGISIFIASGDHGAHDCRFWPLPRTNQQYRDLGLSVTAPGSEDVILVGGTYLSTNEDGSYFEEAGWEDPLTGWATGGGVSSVYPRPPWQAGVGVENEFSTGRRQVPDVAGPADSDSGWLVVYTPPGENEVVGSVSGGTSASAPFWAASMLLARQLAEQEGVAAPGFSRLGFLGPLFYELAGESQPGSLFNDVVRGGNLYHNATAGWDYATGLGSPRVAPLARAIVDSLR